MFVILSFTVVCKKEWMDLSNVTLVTAYSISDTVADSRIFGRIQDSTLIFVVIFLHIW